MNHTDTIKEILLEHPFGGPEFGGCECGQIIGGAQDVWADHLAPIIADATTPRTITTAEELDALADRSVVRSRYHNTFVRVGEYVEGEPCWCGMDGGDYASSDISLPATVLWEPGDEDE